MHGLLARPHIAVAPRAVGVSAFDRRPPSMTSPRRITELHGLLLAGVLFFLPAGAQAHDPSAWGGLFRSRDSGATWFPANEGRFVSGALALAISPTDGNHLLLATDSGLLRSRNGGRDWEVEAPAVLIGAVFAATFDKDGHRALASTSSGIFRTDDGSAWRKTPAPDGAAPAHALVPGAVAGRVYLAGSRGLAHSENWGESWSSADGLPDGPVQVLVAASGPPEIVYAIIGGRIWASTDGAHTWQLRDAGIPDDAVDALALDPRKPARLWAAGADRLFASDDGGESWYQVGRPLSEPNTSVRGIAVAASGPGIVLTTHRGVFRSPDGGQRWEMLADNLPVHLEAGPLVRDPVDPATLYAGFALTPYGEIWRIAAEGGTLLSRVDPLSFVGAAIFLIVLVVGTVATLRWLARYYRTPVDAGSPPTRRRGGIGETVR